MERKLLVVLLTVSLACGGASASADDSFLNQKLPTTWVHYSSPQELLQVLKSVVPKTLVLPEGMSVPEGMPETKPATVSTAPDWGKDGALFGRVPGDKTPFTMRNYVDQAVRFMGMTWTYDAARDAVVLDFPWHVTDLRSNAELMQTLVKTIPPEDGKHIYSSTVDPKTDPWRLAFNSLLSKPENFPKTWQMRWRGNDGLPPGSTQPKNLFTGKILDETGTAHFMILNIEPPMFFPSESTIDFYLFTASGKFEHGGVFYAEDRWGEASAEVDADQNRLFVHNDNKPSHNRYDQVFAVEKDRFVFKDHLTNGKPTPPENSFKYLFEVNAD